MNVVVRILIYVVWAVFSLLVFVYLTFPTDVLRDVVTVQLENRLGGAYQVQIDDVSLAGLTGVTLTGVRLLPRAGLAPTNSAESGEEGAAEAGGDAAPQMTLPTLLDEVTFTLDPLSLGGAVPAIDFDVVLGDGVIYGAVEPDSESGGFRISVSAENAQLIPNLGMLSNLAGARMMGTLTGQVELVYEAGEGGRPVLSGGGVNLVVQNLVRGPGPLSLIYLETNTRMGDLAIVAELDGSDLDIETFQATGGADFEMEVGGRVNIRSPMDETTLYLTAHLGFAEEWMESNGLTGAFDREPTLRSACADNQCAFALRGRVGDGVRPQPLRR